MFIKHLGISLEATHNVLGRFDAIHAHDGFFIEQRTYCIGGTPARSALNNAALFSNGDGDGIGTYLSAASFEPDGAFFKVDGCTIKQSARSFKEVSGIAFGLEADDVI